MSPRIDKRPNPHPIFLHLVKEARIPAPVAELRFAPPRRWRFDYAWPVQKVALEVEGGVWSRGRHTRGAGFLADAEKYNRAALLGWRLFRCTPDTLATLETVNMLGLALTPCQAESR